MKWFKKKAIGYFLIWLIIVVLMFTISTALFPLDWRVNLICSISIPTGVFIFGIVINKAIDLIETKET